MPSFYILLSIIGFISCCLAMIAAKYVNRRYIPIMAIFFLASAMFMLVSSYRLYYFVGTRQWSSLVTTKLPSPGIDPTYAFLLSNMSSLVAYEGRYRVGILRMYDAIDLQPMIPDIKDMDIANNTLVWSYELVPTEVERRGKSLYKGR